MTHDLRSLAEDMWARRHSLTTSEWLEAGPLLLGMVVAKLSEEGGGEAALAIGEDAFRAGYKAGVDWSQGPYAEKPNNGVDEAWSAYEPPEDIKELA